MEFRVAILFIEIPLWQEGLNVWGNQVTKLLSFSLPLLRSV